MDPEGSSLPSARTIDPVDIQNTKKCDVKASSNRMPEGSSLPSARAIDPVDIQNTKKCDVKASSNRMAGIGASRVAKEACEHGHPVDIQNTKKCDVKASSNRMVRGGDWSKPGGERSMGAWTQRAHRCLPREQKIPWISKTRRNATSKRVATEWFEAGIGASRVAKEACEHGPRGLIAAFRENNRCSGISKTRRKCHVKASSNRMVRGGGLEQAGWRKKHASVDPEGSSLPSARAIDPVDIQNTKKCDVKASSNRMVRGGDWSKPGGERSMRAWTQRAHRCLPREQKIPWISKTRRNATSKRVAAGWFEVGIEARRVAKEACEHGHPVDIQNTKKCDVKASSNRMVRDPVDIQNTKKCDVKASSNRMVRGGD
ncbi:uncharacterized protein PITG_20653 [Phytophthora infestans T30-4]|uniref:Uncharacterized protein n=1 Tax=Phytophthora infestans (strain T30-4) TaxID=403677 RepID=D0P2X9_PHYIT|nr:uncharacterized protein PITG_20653 [Phytophthora infestans T30-4]EEY58501.1 hypothetical protein PITG_20653 [Phytophthora infestans T30-4]|eukprot:XP_002895345.1 hypothetical protein PITG_20653 [Phytophthora infestans T30-4]